MNLERLADLPSIRTISPAYLTESDHPWLRELLDERENFVGRKRREWKIRLGEGLKAAAPRSKLRVALGVLDRQSQDQTTVPVTPRKIRAAVFRQAVQEPVRSKALAGAALALGMAAQDVLTNLFADLPDERTLMPLRPPCEPADIALACNAAIVASLLSRALRARIDVRGRVRAVVRHARLMGLLCRATTGQTKDEVTLEISGPYVLFRHTRIYGRALSSLVSRLAWCHSYRLEADCVLDGDANVGRLVICAGAPITPARELAPFDSKLEERFARAFTKLAPEWDAIREPRAIPVDGALIFPDFELCHRATGERWLLEIAGYWTADYIRKKLTSLRRARLEHLILCIDEARCCTDEALQLDARVVRYRRKLDPRAVLAIVDPAALTKRA